MRSVTARKANSQTLRLQISGSPAARRAAPARRQLTQWAAMALGRRARGAEISLRVVGSVESRRLNRRYRGKDQPTNVLSFPAGAMPVARASAAATPLGDLVICAPLLQRESREQGKALRAHWAHLVVHGALHLAGYDHENDPDARRMERREVWALRRLGFPNPYRQRVMR
jgi:probable rRNA maturation factor